MQNLFKVNYKDTNVILLGPMHEQSCKLWKGGKVLKQCESNILKCDAFMLSILLFIFIRYVYSVPKSNIKVYHIMRLRFKKYFSHHRVNRLDAK